MKLCNYKMVNGKGSVVFRYNGSMVSVNSNNLTDELAELAIKAGYSHCFEKQNFVKKNEKQLNSQLPESLSTLNEVSTEETESLPAVENKREGASLTKKKGRKKKD